MSSSQITANHRAWIAALRSGDYKQAKNALRND